MGWIATLLIRQIGRAAAKRFAAATREPVGGQQRKSLEILRRNRDTDLD